jgi:hypothetical protein
MWTINFEKGESYHTLRDQGDMEGVFEDVYRGE